ncbi:MAG: protein kinase [Desulfococcaceae bacterium]
MKKIGRYTVRALLGQGGMGKVFKVEMPVTGRLAAMKLLKPNPLTVRLMGMESLRELFVSEAVIMAGLRHPNLLDIWDFDEDNQGNPFYITDYYCNNLGIMIGESSEAEKPCRVISTDRAIHYMHQILLGLACLHHSGIIHRDIKPANLLVTDQDTVKICDFGLSKFRKERFRGPASLKVGSPWYAAPEQEKNPDEADFTADIYSAGVTLYRMLTGILPADRVQKPSDLNPDMDEDWNAFIFQAIHQDSGQRFASARQMLAVFDQLSADWEARKQNICRFSFPEKQERTGGISRKRTLRCHPVKVRAMYAQERFGLDDLWQPGEYVQNRFTVSENGTVSDESTGLMWEHGGAEYPLTWKKAGEYIDSLRRQRFAEYENWRLPSIEELMSLLIRTPRGRDFCMEPVFDQTRKWLWSCDLCTFISAWYVSLDLGFVFWQDFSAYYYVRGVRSMEKG